MGRAERLKRVRAILWLLEDSPEGLTTAELAQRLSVSERTARRDLLTLRAAGYPLTSAASRWRFVEGQALPSALASDGAGEVAERDKVMAIDAAIRARRPLGAAYASLREPKSGLTLKIAPRTLRYVEGSLFLVAREHPRGRLRALAVERLSGLRHLKGRAKREDQEVLERYLETRLRDDAFRELIRVSVRFEPEAAWRVQERVWHASQRVRVSADGSALVQLRVAGYSWVKAWILGFGADATALGPLSLVRQVCGELQVSMQRYCEVADAEAQLDLFALRK